MLDMSAWIGVLGLLDECPIVPAALTAVLDGGTAGHSVGLSGSASQLRRFFPGVAFQRVSAALRAFACPLPAQ